MLLLLNVIRTTQNIYIFYAPKSHQIYRPWWKPNHYVWLLEEAILTATVEPEGLVMRVDSNWDRPHTGHGTHKVIFAQWDFHKACNISCRVLRIIPAYSILWKTKIKKKNRGYCHPPPGEQESLRTPLNWPTITQVTRHLLLRISKCTCL